MKWRKTTVSGVIKLETPIGAFWICKFNKTDCYTVMGPHSNNFEDEYPTLQAAKQAIENYINVIAAELSEGIQDE